MPCAAVPRMCWQFGFTPMPGGFWMLFARLNLHINGGRFIQAARSVGADLAGPYLPWQKIEVQGYDDGGEGNVYEANVEMNPIDDETVLGFFPVNLGEPGVPNGDGIGYIALAVSCDGFHWSEFVPLVWSRGLEGRMYDHPIDGLHLIDGEVHWCTRRTMSFIMKE
eukprot:5769527-Prymnesium_polylepis.1